MEYEVILPVKNECENIRRLLPSLLLQTIKPRRFIVVDDASADCTREVLDMFKNDAIKKIYLKNNIGKQNILSILFKLYKPDAEYVVIMDADVILPRNDTIEKVLNEAKGGSVVFTSYDVSPSRNPLWLGFRFSALLLHEINKCSQTHLIGGGALVILKKDLFNKIKMPPGIYRDDLYLYLYAKCHLGVRPKYIYGMPITLRHRSAAPVALARKLAKAATVEERLRRFPVDNPPPGCIASAFLKVLKQFPAGLPVWALLKVVSTLYAKFS